MLSLVNRRYFLSCLFPAISALAMAQHAAVSSSGKVKVCAENVSTVKCPLGHASCRMIDGNLVVGNGDETYPNWAQVPKSKLLMCDECHVLFAEMN